MNFHTICKQGVNLEGITHNLVKSECLPQDQSALSENKILDSEISRLRDLRKETSSIEEETQNIFEISSFVEADLLYIRKELPFL